MTALKRQGAARATLRVKVAFSQKSKLLPSLQMLLEKKEYENILQGSLSPTEVHRNYNCSGLSENHKQN